MALLILLGLLAAVGFGLAVRRAILARFRPVRTGASRSTQVVRWAAVNMLHYGLTALVALVLLGRSDALVIMPDELRYLAWGWGLPAEMGLHATYMLGCVFLGAAIAAVMLVIRRRLGLGPIRLIYRSPAAVQGPGEWPAAVLLACAAGVGEELFFRLALPLAAAIATGSALTGIGIATVAFGAGHRHQGWLGVVATALIGALLSWFYLLTGALWVPVLLHVTINLNALILRPWLTRPLSS